MEELGRSFSEDEGIVGELGDFAGLVGQRRCLARALLLESLHELHFLVHLRFYKLINFRRFP